MADLQRRFPATAVSNWTSGAFGTPAELPGAPSDLAGTAGNTQVALTWTAGAANAGTLTGYKVEKNSGSWSDVTADTGSTSTSYTVTGLTNGTAYTFRVSAINEVGTGAASSASSSVTPYTVPGAPSGLSATAVTQTENVDLSWSAPGTPGGSPVTGYAIKRDSTVTVADTGDTPTTFTDGESSGGTPYTYYVAGVNAGGIGTYSPGAAVTTNTLPPTAFEAVGGTTSTYTDGPGTPWKVHTYTSSSMFVVLAGSNPGAQALIVAGGGGGDSQSGGGGGGGMEEQPFVASSTGGPTSNGVFTVTVGAGGENASGSPSVMGPFSASGGGRGGGSPGATAGSPGGSGGGGGGRTSPPATGAGGSGVGGEGNSGGAGGTSGPYWGSKAGGGGGGKNAAGGAAFTPDGVSYRGGDGGAGGPNSYKTGSPILYAGGGAGYGSANPPPGAPPGFGESTGPGGQAGPGGGGFSSYGGLNNAMHGTAQTGGGAGGGNTGPPAQPYWSGLPSGGFAFGGSGIVVIRYPLA